MANILCVYYSRTGQTEALMQEIAQELGNMKVANMVMLGAYIQAMGNLKVETIKEMLVHMFTGPKAKLVDLNIEALARGAACVK